VGKLKCPKADTRERQVGVGNGLSLIPKADAHRNVRFRGTPFPGAGQLQTFSRSTQFARKRPFTVRSIVRRHSSGRFEPGRSTLSMSGGAQRRPVNLEVPTHMYVSDSTILIGADEQGV